MSTNVSRAEHRLKLFTVGVFGAISTVLMLLSDSQHAVYPNISEARLLRFTVLLGGYLLGPLHGRLHLVKKCCSTSSITVSLTNRRMNLIGSLSFYVTSKCFTIASPYFKSAVISLVMIQFQRPVVTSTANYFVMFHFLRSSVEL